jgi:hypothetical protein
MALVLVRVEPGREWVMHLTRVPVSATRPQDCVSTFVQLDRDVALEAGAVVVECLRNDRGVQAAVVMPNGYCFPTGRIAPRASWFPMLKAHLRMLLGVSPDGRVFQCARTGIETLTRQRDEGKLAPDKAARAVARLQEVLDGLEGGPPPASDADLAAEFATWAGDAAARSGRTRAEVVAAVGRAIRAGEPQAAAADDAAQYVESIQRFLDL